MKGVILCGWVVRGTIKMCFFVEEGLVSLYRRIVCGADYGIYMEGFS
jgi:hypothetical protein